MVLPNTNAQEQSIENEKYVAILRLFEKQKEITRTDVEKALGGGTTHAINMLREMLDKDLIGKIGNGRLTRYVSKEAK